MSVEAAFAPDDMQQSVLTLGGLAYNAWIEGEVIMDTGILDQQLALMVPVSVECGI